MGLTLRNIVLNLLYYGVVVAILPYCLLSAERSLGLSQPAFPILRIASIAVGLFGALLQLWSIVVFQRVGGGTPSPPLPPKQLVIRGPYWLVRNPMNVGEIMVLLALSGWFGSAALIGYATAAALAFHIFIVRWEEPSHIARFGDDYRRYKARVNRWLPRLRALRG